MRVGGAIVTGTFPRAGRSVSSIPSWAQISSGTVARIGTSVLTDVQPSPSPGGTFRYVIDAWSGGTLVTLANGEMYYLIRGGGHGNYAGNEMYLWGPILSANPAWQRIDGPTDSIVSDVLWQSDGRPSTSHTRSTLVGGRQNELWMIGQGGVWMSGSVASREAMRYEFGTGWDAQDTWPTVTYGIRGVCAYNPNDDLIWLRGDDHATLETLDPDTGTLTQYGVTHDGSIEGTGAIDTVRNQLYVNNQRTGVQFLYDLSSPATDPLEATSFSGTPPPAKSGIQYDAERDCYTALDDTDLSLVYELDPVTRAWDTRSFTGDTSQALSTDYEGHFTRWIYVPQLAGTLFVGHVGEPVAFYKS